LYQALDVCLISSRWEGGPYSALEALAAGSVVVSSPVGIARDVLPSECLYSSVGQAVEILVGHARTGSLKAFCREAASRAAVHHGPEAVKEAYAAIYRNLPQGKAPAFQVVGASLGFLLSRIKTGLGATAAPQTDWCREVESAVVKNQAHHELIEYPCGGSRAEVMQTAARIRVARRAL